MQARSTRPHQQHPVPPAPRQGTSIPSAISLQASTGKIRALLMLLMQNTSCVFIPNDGHAASNCSGCGHPGAPGRPGLRASPGRSTRHPPLLLHSWYRRENSTLPTKHSIQVVPCVSDRDKERKKIPISLDQLIPATTETISQVGSS